MRILISFFPLGFFAAPFGGGFVVVDILQVKVWANRNGCWKVEAVVKLSL